MSIGYPIGLYRGLLLLTMYIGWRPVSLYGSTIIMNELYTQTEVIRGRTYRYDPDHDCWYPADRYNDMTVWEAWSPVIVLVILSAIAVYIEYWR